MRREVKIEYGRSELCYFDWSSQPSVEECNKSINSNRKYFLDSKQEEQDMTVGTTLSKEGLYQLK